MSEPRPLKGPPMFDPGVLASRGSTSSSSQRSAPSSNNLSSSSGNHHLVDELPENPTVLGAGTVPRPPNRPITSDPLTVPESNEVQSYQHPGRPPPVHHSKRDANLVARGDSNPNLHLLPRNHSQTAMGGSASGSNTLQKPVGSILTTNTTTATSVPPGTLQQQHSGPMLLSAPSTTAQR